QAVRLALLGGELGDELAGGHAHRAGDAVALPYLRPDHGGDLRGRAQPAPGTADVEERLVGGDRLDHRGDRVEDLHHALGDLGVLPVTGRDDRRLRAEPPRPAHRHGRVDAERPGLIGGAEHHAAPGGRADDHRAAVQLGPFEQLDAGEEGVHVDVEDRAAGVVGPGPRSGADAGDLLACHAPILSEQVFYADGRRPTTCNWAAMSRSTGWDEAVSSSATSASAAPGSPSTSRLGTRSAKTRTPRTGPASSPASASRPVSAPPVKRRGVGSRSPQLPSGSASTAPASSNCPASARWTAAPTGLAASTLTAPPGRSSPAIAARASAGSSTYSSTL